MKLVEIHLERILSDKVAVNFYVHVDAIYKIANCPKSVSYVQFFKL